ncbi:unnamed protein product, partial [Closterium sp. Yama58-4]
DSARSTRGGQLSAGDLLGGEERVGAREQRDAAWSACALTGEALREPIVVCQLGRLYNRESVLQLLLWRAGVVAEESHKWRFTRLQDQLHRFAHIRTTKDIVTVQFSSLTHPPESDGAESTRGDSSRGDSDRGDNETNNVSCRRGGDTNAAGAAAAGAGAGVTTGANNLSGSFAAIHVLRRLKTGAGAVPGSSAAIHGGMSRTGGSSSSSAVGVSGGSAASSRDASHWVCALSGASASTGVPFSLLRPCGHAFSTRALAQVERLQQQLKVKGRAKRKGVPACDPSRPHSDTQSPSENKRSCKNI